MSPKKKNEEIMSPTVADAECQTDLPPPPLEPEGGASGYEVAPEPEPEGSASSASSASSNEEDETDEDDEDDEDGDDMRIHLNLPRLVIMLGGPPPQLEDLEESETESATESETESATDSKSTCTTEGMMKMEPPPRRSQRIAARPPLPPKVAQGSSRPKRPRERSPAPPPNYTRAEQAYFNKQPLEARKSILQAEKKMKLASDGPGGKSEMPMRFKILQSPMDDATKAVILSKLDQFQKMHEGSGEYFKLRNWLNQACRLPLGKYKHLPVSSVDQHDEIATYLQGVRGELDKTVYGHGDAKDQIISVLSRWISNPGSKGQCIGIQGPMGCSKTTLVKDGICRALGLPFGFVALGGASDGAFLEGHGFTYEGSQPGRISEILMRSGFMNTILFFDELDKVSSTRKGDEIIGILTHLTDASQNERFCDRYFSDIDLDLSRSLIVFSYNDETLINPILKDRMVTIRVTGYNKAQKLVIARDYLMPSILSEYKLTKEDIVISDSIIEYVIDRVEQSCEEEGVRNLRRGLDAIVGAINMHRYVPPLITLPVVVTDADVKKYVKLSEDPTKLRASVRHSMYI